MNMRAKISFVAIITVLTVSVASCGGSKQTRPELKTFEKNGGWGYEILLNEKRYIYQEHIPAIEGKVPFASKKDAELVGRLILKKIMNKETPTVHTGELIKLGIKDAS